jgi:hypothetical protein
MAEWILDSDASHHVTNDINSLSSFLPYDGMVSLHIGNDTGMAIHHIGSLSFTISNFTFLLQDIFHVPTFTTNLLSLSKLLIDNSILIEFTSSSCLIKDRATKTLLLQAKLINGLYILLLPPSISPKSFLATVDLWHLELVHSDVSGPAHLLSNDGFRYYVLFIDDFIKFTWIYFLHSKDELLKVFTLFKLQAENQLNTTIKTL